MDFTSLLGTQVITEGGKAKFRAIEERAFALLEALHSQGPDNNDKARAVVQVLEVVHSAGTAIVMDEARKLGPKEWGRRLSEHFGRKQAVVGEPQEWATRSGGEGNGDYGFGNIYGYGHGHGCGLDARGGYGYGYGDGDGTDGDYGDTDGSGSGYGEEDNG